MLLDQTIHNVYQVSRLAKQVSVVMVTSETLKLLSNNNVRRYDAQGFSVLSASKMDFNPQYRIWKP